jgi:Neuraminidase (sialidase)
MNNFAELKEKLAEFNSKDIFIYYSKLDLDDACDSDAAVWCSEYQFNKDVKIISQLLAVIEMQNEALNKYKEICCEYNQGTVSQRYAAKTCLSETESKLKQLITKEE